MRWSSFPSGPSWRERAADLFGWGEVNYFAVCGKGMVEQVLLPGGSRSFSYTPDVGRDGKMQIGLHYAFKGGREAQVVWSAPFDVHGKR